MKTLLINILIFYYKFIIDIIGLILYGKLSKVSTYHSIYDKNEYTFYQTFNDTKAQGDNLDNISDKAKLKIIDNYIDTLREYPAFKENTINIEVPIFYGKDIIGTRGIYSVLLEVRNEMGNNTINLK